MKQKISILTLIFSILFHESYSNKPFIDSINALEQLKSHNIWNENNPLKLHIGCGEQHFNGYINIDYPTSEHTVQRTIGADVFADLTALNFPQQTVDEVRSHHVFEHFDRPSALALLCKWNQWLKIGGMLVIETPDFEASIKMLLDTQYSFDQKQSIMRHVFGSHEADWAIHCDGWYRDKFHHTLTALGFENITFEFTQWQLTRNIIVRATKKRNIDSAAVAHQAKKILRESMVDHSSSEEQMWQVWCNLLNNALSK